MGEAWKRRCVTPSMLAGPTTPMCGSPGNHLDEIMGCGEGPSAMSTNKPVVSWPCHAFQTRGSGEGYQASRKKTVSWNTSTRQHELTISE